jgi:hypothetical protein
VRICEEELGLSEPELLPMERSADLNPMLVCLVITWGAGRSAKGSVEAGITLSALADWQRSRGVRSEDLISQQSSVQLTLPRAIQLRFGTKTNGYGSKGPLTIGLLRLLIGWLAAKVVRQLAEAPRCACDACWLVVRFVGFCVDRSCLR